MSAKLMPAARTRIRMSPVAGRRDRAPRVSRTRRARRSRGMTAWRIGRRSLPYCQCAKGPGLASQRASIASSAFCACSRFSAWSNTTDAAESMTSSVTSSPRCAGRQCMNSASRPRLRHQRRVHLVGREHREPSARFRFLAHRRPDVGVDGIGAAHGRDGIVRASSSAPPSRATRATTSLNASGSSKPIGDATRTCAPSIAAACASDVATLLPSPTNAIVRPRRLPHVSISVRQSASAWQGCSSSVSALTTRSRGAAAANSSSRACAYVRTTAADRPSARGCARRPRSSRVRRARRRPAARSRRRRAHAPRSERSSVSAATASRTAARRAAHRADARAAAAPRAPP